MNNDEFPRITCEELKEHLDNGERPVIIDTRHRNSYQMGHIPGAVNIMYDITGDPVERDMLLASLPGGRLTVIYCDCLDDGVSISLAQEMIDMRFDSSHLRALRGGISRWFELGYELV